MIKCFCELAGWSRRHLPDFCLMISFASSVSKGMSHRYIRLTIHVRSTQSNYESSGLLPCIFRRHFPLINRAGWWRNDRTTSCRRGVSQGCINKSTHRLLVTRNNGSSPTEGDYCRSSWWLDFDLIVQQKNDTFSKLRPGQNGRHFADDTYRRIFFNENVKSSIKISLKFVPKGPMNNIPALVQLMARRRPGDKPLSEPMMARLPTHIYASLGLNELDNWTKL